MQAINFVSQWITWVISVIAVLASAMVGYQAWMKSMATSEDEILHRNKLIKQTIKGSIVAISLGGFISFVKYFFV